MFYRRLLQRVVLRVYARSMKWMGSYHEMWLNLATKVERYARRLHQFFSNSRIFEADFRAFQPFSYHYARLIRIMYIAILWVIFQCQIPANLLPNMQFNWTFCNCARITFIHVHNGQFPWIHSRFFNSWNMKRSLARTSPNQNKRKPFGFACSHACFLQTIVLKNGIMHECAQKTPNKNKIKYTILEFHIQYWNSI